MHLFYHLGMYGHWKYLYQNQINQLYVSGLLSAADTLTIGVSGGTSLYSVPEKANVVYFNDNNYENNTLKLIRDFASSEVGDSPLMYFHNKGTTHTDSPSFVYNESWRFMMEYFMIHKWADAVGQLSGVDVVGTNWVTYPRPHFSGNFWWSKSSYINKLDHSMLDSYKRPDEEFWIGSASHLPNFSKIDMHNTGLQQPRRGGHSEEFYPQEKYVDSNIC